MELFEDIIGLEGMEWPHTLFCSQKHITLKISEAAIFGGGNPQKTAQSIKK